MKYLQIASKVMNQRASGFERDRDSFLAGLNADERIAYRELTEIMTSPKYWTTPEAAHLKVKEIIGRYRQNQKERVIHAKAS